MKKFKWLIIAAVSTVGVAALITGLFFSLQIYSQGRIPNGTVVAGVDLSLESGEGATEKLKKITDVFLDTKITVTAEHKNLHITPRQLGVTILPEKTVQTIMKHDSNKEGLLNFFFPKNSPKAELILFINQETLAKELETQLKISEIAPISANFYLEKKKLKITEGKKGFGIEREEIIKTLKESAKTLTPKRIQIKFKYEDPNVTAEGLEEQRESTSSALLHIFTLVDPIYNDNWDERLIDHEDWVTFEPTPERVNIKIKEGPFNTYVDEEISKWLDVPADKVVISMDENENVTIKGRGGDGSVIKRKELKDKLEVAIANKIKNIPIPIEKTVPELEIDKKLQDLGIKDRIAVGHTSYYGSPANRVHNIKTGAAKFDGKLIKPDESFSFNTNLGQVDGSTGYKKELVIKPEGTIPEYGGGICQVSTTMYRAILLAGLPVVERNQHSYAVGYYSQILGHGLDATIYLGGADLKFKNDTGHHILVQTYTKDDYELFFVFYGTDIGRSVELDGPYISGHRQPGPVVYIETEDLLKGQTKQVEKKHVGFDAVWYRYITDAAGAIEIETISTRYKTVPDKILVGTREE